MFHNGKKQKICCRSYKNFDENSYQNDLSTAPFHVSEIFDCVDDSYWFCQELMLEVMNRHAPTKTKVITHSQVPYMNCKLRKSINVKHMLQRRWKKCPTESNWEQFRRQRNLVTSLQKRSIQHYLKEKCQGTTNGKEFWNTVNPLISDKYMGSSEITLMEKGSIVNDGTHVSNILNDYYVNITKEIGTPNNLTDNLSVDDITESHRSDDCIKYIKQNIAQESHFSFSEVSLDVIYNKLICLNTRKSTGHDNIPPKLVKTGANVLCRPLHYLVNQCIQTCTFPSPLKYAEVTPIFKKKDRLNKENYRPVSVLPYISKIFKVYYYVSLKLARPLLIKIIFMEHY